MDYQINDFVNLLRSEMYANFPFLYDRGLNPNGSYKHGKYNQEIRDVAFMNNPLQIINENMIVFDIGNDYAERFYPYYHILEDAPIIRKRGRGTEKTKGSQDKISKLSARDYGIVTFNNKTFTKEYAKNVRGARRSVIDNSTRYVDGKKINRSANSYENIHYHYIENMLTKVNPIVAQYFNLKYGKPFSNGLAEEYIMDEYHLPTISEDTMQNVIQILGM